LIASFARIKLALEHDFSNLDSIDYIIARLGPCIDINERLFNAAIDGGVPLVLDSFVPWLIVIVIQLLPALVLQAERSIEPAVSVRPDHFRVKIIACVMDSREDNGGGVRKRIALEHLHLQRLPLAVFCFGSKPFYSIAQWTVEEVPRLISILVFAREVGHRKQVC